MKLTCLFTLSYLNSNSCTLILYTADWSWWQRDKEVNKIWLACSRRSDSRARSSNGGERVKLCVGQTWGDRLNAWNELKYGYYGETKDIKYVYKNISWYFGLKDKSSSGTKKKTTWPCFFLMKCRLLFIVPTKKIEISRQFHPFWKIIFLNLTFALDVILNLFTDN